MGRQQAHPGLAYKENDLAHIIRLYQITSLQSVDYDMHMLVCRTQGTSRSGTCLTLLL